MIYLDHAAATPVDPAVLAAMQPFWTDDFYNPSAPYTRARKIHATLEDARKKVAGVVGSRPAEIIFTAGGTEANNLALHGVMQQFPDANMVVSAVEHKSVLEAAELYSHKVAPVYESGVVDALALQELIDDDTVLVSVMYANNEVGSVQPLNRIVELAKQIRQERAQRGNTLPLYVHTDASQAGNYLDLHAKRLGVDMMTLNGGKIYGPKQTGALFVKAGIVLQPLIRGGGQERGLRSGTENVAGVVGFATALEQAQERRKTEVERLQKLQELFAVELTTMAPTAVLNGFKAPKLPNFIHVTFPGVDNERLMMQLDEAGIMCAVGSACQASNEDPSHVLMTMGLTTEAAQSSLRFSMGHSTTETDIKKTLQTLRSLLA